MSVAHLELERSSSTTDRVTVRVTVNGTQRTLSLDPRSSLLDVLRETLARQRQRDLPIRIEQLL